tara:strand:+ start:2410 stop:3027 length:618 start_codon:yes stop_codon:yes gene_type:complete
MIISNKLTYSTDDYDFRSIICDYLNLYQLDNIFVDQKITKENNQSTEYHKRFYNSLDNDDRLKSLYDNFISKVIKNLFDEEIIYQVTPTFRLQAIDNVSVFAFHKDTEYGHSDKTINFFLPITKCYDTNALWVESGSSFEPMECDYGDLITFDAVNLLHGNKVNKTGKSRISLDFRVMKMVDYCETSKQTLSKNRRLILGDYYTK